MKGKLSITVEEDLISKLDDIVKSFEKEGYKVLSKKYKSGQPIEFICPKGHEHRIKWESWQIGARCYYCTCGF